ncbi:MAG: C10 family peptidase [Bacteroidales bacterium]|nr:C10 family peptidase [Bacteroidales bacterium]
MKIKQYSFVLAMLLGLSSATAAPINPQTALRVAQNFWKGVTSKVANVELIPESSFQHLYIIHVNQSEGFVVVSADDRAYPILGYGIDNVVGDMGPETRFWLQQYEHEIEALATGTVRNDDVMLADYIAREWSRLLSNTWTQPKSGHMVPALISTRWDQSPLYNYYCPSGCPAGCVATAMAQVMKYWNHPIKGSGSHSYNTTYGILSANFDSTYYDWDNMPNRLTTSSTMQQIHAVAELSYHIGVAVEMNYETDGSGASLVGGWYGASGLRALQNYFGYNNSTIHGVQKSSFTDAEWIELLKEELDAGRPVLYSGYDNSAGHAFVFDGYNSSNHFHINWGWGGSYNGFYAMGALNPGGGGVGTNTSNTFNNSNQAIVGVQPMARTGFSPALLTFTAEGGEQNVEITSFFNNTSNWTATCTETWLVLNPTTGTGNGAIVTGTVSAQPNNSNRDRFGYIILVQGNDTMRLPVQQLACSASEMCVLTINVYDSRSNGWEGGSLTLSSTSGSTYGEMKLNDGSYGIQSFSVCPDTVLAIWHHGSSDTECGFFIENANGVVWISHEPGNTIADTFMITNPCDTSGGLEPIVFTLTTMVNDSTRGNVQGADSPISFGESVTLTANANEGYRFTKWNDGSVSNPRTLTVTANRNLTARFENLGTDTLHYDNGNIVTAYGTDDEIYWAIRIPTSQLVGHPTLESIKFYNIRSNNYTLNVYQGDSPRMANLISTQTFYLNRQARYRWIEQRLNDPIHIDHSKPLWVVMGCQSDGAPATVSSWCGNNDGSWVSSDGEDWHPLTDEGIHATWMLRAHMPVDPNEYTLNVSTNNRKWGTATGGGVYRYGEAATLTATPAEGFHFERWSDNDTTNPRTLYVKDNLLIRAIFDEGELGISPSLLDQMTIHVEGHNLYVRGAEGLPLSVYDALGRCIYKTSSHTKHSIMLPAAGVYIIRLNSQTIQKIVAPF